MTGPLPIARKLGKLLKRRDEIPVAEPIQRRVAYPSRPDVWPAEMWAEMQRIQNDGSA